MFAVVTVGAPGGAAMPGRLSAGCVGGPCGGRAGGLCGGRAGGACGGSTGARPSLVRRILPGLGLRSSSSSEARLPSPALRCPGVAVGGLGPGPGLGGSELRKAIRSPDTCCCQRAVAAHFNTVVRRYPSRKFAEARKYDLRSALLMATRYQAALARTERQIERPWIR